MRVSIMFKSTAVLILSILIGALGIFLTSRYLIHQGFDHSIHNELGVIRQIVDDAYANTKKRLLQETKMLAGSEEMKHAIQNGSYEALKKFAVNALAECEANFVMVLDMQGTILVRGHNDIRGDSVAEFDIVRVALSGQPITEAVDLKKSGLSVGAAAPIITQGKQVGVLMLGNAFKTNAFVDEIKRVTGKEMTIFDGDTRISTSIINTNGQRAVGTKLNNPTVQAAVLTGGGVYANRAAILGRPYRTVYWPIKESSGKILGMWFIGTSVDVVERTVSKITIYSLIATTAIVLTLSLLGFLFFRRLVMPLKETVDYAKAVSDGDLTRPLPVTARKDEVGDLVTSLGHMVSSLREKISVADQATSTASEKSRIAEEALREAEEAAHEARRARSEGMHSAASQLENVVNAISASASELSSQIEESDRGATESAQHLNEAATAMKEMNSTVQEVARNASQAASVSAETRSNAEEGQKILGTAMHSINQVQKVSLELQQDMEQLHTHTQSISQIMNVISDIADQTNLLALNAAIEAARAGEAGRGFAVVADEVRKLAEKTMSSTNDVSRTITAIQDSAQKSVDKMNEALVAVEEANSQAQHSGEALVLIVNNVEKTADQVRAIAAAAEEQSASSEQINQSVLSVNEMSTRTARAMAEASVAISDLARQTESLRALVIKMKEE